MWECPNGCNIDFGIVCGGELPYYNHKFQLYCYPNIYHRINLKGEHLGQVHSRLPFSLTQEDWEIMFDHSDGGCVSEPQCPSCSGYLVWNNKEEIDESD